MRAYTLDYTKLKDAIRLIIDQCDPADLGQVKLHKVLYYSDMFSYLGRGKPITGATYKKRPFGPTCDHLLVALRDLVSEGDIEIRETDYFGYKKKEFHKRAHKNFVSLDSDEIGVVVDVVDFVCKRNTASTISDFSHDIVWDSVEMGQDIPYYLALSWIPSSEFEAANDWADEVVCEVADSRRNENELASHPRTTLRERMAARA